MSLLQGLTVNQTKLAHHKHHKLLMNEWPSPFSLIECEHGWSKTQEKKNKHKKGLFPSRKTITLSFRPMYVADGWAGIAYTVIANTCVVTEADN